MKIVILIGLVMFGVATWMILGKFSDNESLMVAANNSDFRGYYLGGKLILNNARENFFKLEYQYKIQSEYIDGLSSVYLLTPFINLPWIAVFWLGVARVFSYVDGYIFMLSVLITSSLLWIVVCTNQLPSSCESQKFFWLLALVPYFPFVENILQTQTAIWIGLILFTGKQLNNLNKNWLSGFVLSLLSFKPHYLFVVMIYLLITKQFKTIMGVMLGGLMLIGVSFLLVGWTGLVEYVDLVKYMVGWDMAYGMRQNVEVAWRGLVKNEVVWWVAQISSWWILIRTWIKTHDEELQWTALMMGMLLVGIHANAYDLTILSLPAVWWIKKGWGVKALILGYLGTGLTTILVDNFKFIQIGPLVLFFLLVYLLMNVERFNDKEKSYLLQKSLGK
jgi:hypothetical protein